MIRFFITLPEPIAVPDGYTWHKTYDDPTPYGMNQFVHLIFMQSSGESRQRGQLSAAIDCMHRAKGEEPEGDIDRDDLIGGMYTTVIASTIEDRDQGMVSDFATPQEIPIKCDPFNRCVDEISKFIRSYRASLEVLCVAPTYEMLGPVIPYELGDLVPIASDDGVESGLMEPVWKSGGAFTLAHFNLLDVPPVAELERSDEGRVEYFREMLEQGNPLFLWKERFVEARNSIYREGRYGAAVTLSNTATEVLLDGLLSLLYWELKESPERVASIFAEGRLARRVKSNFAELLGGRWVLDGDGYVADWFNNCYKLRHRVVHGGYSPTRHEAEAALGAAFSLSFYCWERLVEKRKDFPRATLIVIAEEGLRKRGKWCRFMQDFSRDIAPTEPSWRKSFAQWRDEMYSSLLSGS
ncbi:hypothetical protein [Streptomyces rhizosphaericola]|uniref:Apea-like HEPN domain-containing protein n=1 Tax=Streptomyces rhizosphaericola TaxID=2564098 RepID=A0ABY2PJ29_9ACTN|nr:hypothetical protein [Streptomyces rhizosphaericola]TGZ10586.1 hypothetical protein E5Z02_09120 [Streptomyces rhizosphaericola]